MRKVAAIPSQVFVYTFENSGFRSCEQSTRKGRESCYISVWLCQLHLHIGIPWGKLHFFHHLWRHCIWGYGEDLLHISLSNEVQGLMRNQSAFIRGRIVCLLIWLCFFASIQSFVLIEGLHCVALNLSVISFPLLVMLFFAASITTLSLQLIEWYTCKVKWFVSHFPFPAGWTTKTSFF